ncbi:hypothetical protein ACFO5Q_17245 [Kordiimonas lipolytica]|uniref:SMODS-associating 2TM beta-strand rich effector domain-containing protein n=1 Tax=Kordiimonas lipolytica TaxID=1662421 RepID=A0ABV8UEC9_9PROT|nr:hypothetical protein [Kordiimonas lipolytica]
MYRVLSKKLIVIAIVWLGIGVGYFFNVISDLFHMELRTALIPVVVWLLINTLLLRAVWRKLWSWFPMLGKIIFPDLNGDWVVTLNSNWPRVSQLLDAASSKTEGIDMASCRDMDLATLSSMTLRARIDQSWFGMEMRLYNPAQNTPIEDSHTILIEPIKANGLKKPGICYMYRQTNKTDNVADDVEFDGSARLQYDADSDCLEGYFWSNRMWRRAMCTAGTITFTRLE